LNYVVLIFLSVALLLSVIALARERRLRLALQQILKRLLERWRAHEDTFHDQLVSDVTTMPPEASDYSRRRPFSLSS
jgi:hypothetical protein